MPEAVIKIPNNAQKIRMKFTTLTFILFLSLFGYSQEKKKIDHTVYDSWKTIFNVQQSRTGSLIAYEINPQVGDGVLHIESIEGQLKKEFVRGKSARINYNENFVAFLIQPGYDTIRTLKLDKVKENKLPKDTLAVYWPASDSLFTAANVKSFQVAEKGDWIAYLSHKDERPNCTCKKCKKCKKKKKKKKPCCEKTKTTGKTLRLMNPNTGGAKVIEQVVQYKLDKTGSQLIYVTSLEGDKDTLAIHALNLNTMEDKTLLKNQLAIKNINYDYNNTQLVFLHSTDTNERKTFTLSYYKTGMSKAELIIDSTTSGMPTSMTISGHAFPYFSRNGERLFVGINTIVEQDPEDTLLASEKANVDVWSGFDLEIQPQQLKNKRREEKKTFKSIYDLSTKSITRIEDDTIEFIRTIDHSNGNVALGYSSSAYKKANTWDFPWKRDLYLVNLKSGERQILKRGQGYTASLAPSGDHLVWYSGEDSSWFAKSTLTGVQVNLTAKENALFASDNNGNPHTPYSEGSGGWTKIDGKEYYIVNSRYDVWALCPAEPYLSFCITQFKGAENKATYRYTRMDYDSTYTTIGDNLFHKTDFDTKDEAYYDLSVYFDETFEGYLTTMDELISSNHRFIYLSKAQDSDRILFRRMNFVDYPELESSTMAFEAPKTLTNTNPQQSDYNWGTVEMVEWKSFSGRELRGLLYKPEDFDSTKSYPMITYYYEKLTNNIHTHYVPKPTASIVFPTEYVSNGYIIFIPDIEYTPGYPAASAYDCVVSGTDFLTQKHSWIDSTRMGLQGQSWGGYQTAQLITMTNKYQAAMAGAPVSNMFSAYGGIRWGSGLSRMFQYERTQSRIGYTIWEKPELYIENSPIFGLPSVTTPLLIMHNDGDGAVPWYQGIELYMGMRRLDKPVWLLNYNGDAHNLMIQANRKDLSIRMRQFFDYYLLDAEIPEWMESGVPAVNKGKNYGIGYKKMD